MSYRDKYSSSSGDSRRYSSRRGDSPPRHRSRRSPSPGPSRGASRPRDPKNLPESFGRISDTVGVDDDLNVVQRMKTSYISSPLQELYDCVNEKRKVKIWTRNYKEVRGILTAYITAFDKHWNLILSDVDEVYLRPKKSKTPFLRDVDPDENLPDMPPKVPRQKKTAAEGETSAEPTPTIKVEDEKEKKRKRKKSKKTSESRALKKIFVRGDNIVMVHPIEDDEEEEEEVETESKE